MRYVSGFSTSWLEIEIIGEPVEKNPKPTGLNIYVDSSRNLKKNGKDSGDNHAFNTPQAQSMYEGSMQTNSSSNGQQSESTNFMSHFGGTS